MTVIPDLHELVEGALAEFGNFWSPDKLAEQEEAGFALEADLAQIAFEQSESVSDNDLLSLVVANPGILHIEVAQPLGGWGGELTVADMLRHGVAEMIYAQAFESLCSRWELHRQCPRMGGSRPSRWGLAAQAPNNSIVGSSVSRFL